VIEHYKNDLLTLTKQADISFNGTGVCIEGQSTKKYKYSTGKFLYYTDIGSIHKDKWKCASVCVFYSTLWASGKLLGW